MSPEEYLMGLSMHDGSLAPKPSAYLRRVKPVLEWGVVVASLPLTLPLLLVLAVLVKLSSPGPVFLRLKCLGRDARPYWQWRLRVVYLDAAMRSRQATPDPAARDPRVTWIGEFLLRSQFNQLPQIFNILAGDMALVGPRARTAHQAEAPGAYSLQLRPGLLDPSELCRALIGGTADPEAIALAYSRRASMRLDAQIILAALRSRVVGSDGLSQKP